MPGRGPVEGITKWYLGGEEWGPIGGNVIEESAEGARKVLGADVVQRFERVAHAAWQVKSRLEVLDNLGIAAQILYPNAIGFSSNHMLEVEDVALRTVILQTYNDYLMDPQAESSGRLFPQGLLPI